MTVVEDTGLPAEDSAEALTRKFQRELAPG